MTPATDGRGLNRWNAHRLALWAFPIVLWLVATIGLGGSLGKSTDDYSTNLRDPVSNSLAHGFKPFAEYSYFWRPAHVWLIHALQSYGYEYDRLIHATSAVVHGVVSFLLFLLIRRCSKSAIAAGAAAMLFLVLPIHHEALYFTSTISTMIAAALLLWLAFAVARDASLSPSDRRWWHIAAMAVISLAIPFFYEQAGACVIALPLLWLASTEPSANRLTPRSFARPLVITALTAAMQGAMLLALLGTAPGGRRGSGASIRPIGEWADSWMAAAARLLDLLAGHRATSLIGGGLGLAPTSIMASVLWVWLVPLGLTALAFMLTVWRYSTAYSAEPQNRTTRLRLLLVAFGLIAAAAALVPPALVTGQGVPPRLTYIPTLALAIALGGVIALATSALGRHGRRMTLIVGAPVLATVAISGALTLMGVQVWYQSRARSDVAIARQLQRLIPEPPSETIFVPVRIEHTTTRSGDVLFDRLRHGAFETIWSATALARQTYRRRDVWAAGWNPWRQPVIDSPSTFGVRLNDRFVIWAPFPPAQPHGTVLPWARLIPFSVDERGRVRLVRQMVLHGQDQPRQVFEVPLVAAALQTGAIRKGQTQIVEFPSLKRPAPSPHTADGANEP